MPEQELISNIARTASRAGGRALLIGGCVRDAYFGSTPKDFDLELFGIPEDEMERVLGAAAPHVIRVGNSFPVWKAWSDDMGQGSAVDVAMPRREAKTGPRHTDFEVITDPHMTFAEAAARRDFTMNALGLDPLTGELLDPHGGVADIKAGLLRHTSHHFSEDPLRVLRGAQFCGRFQLDAHPDTIEICKQLTPDNLAAERLFEEFRKLLLKSRQPSRGLRFLAATGWDRHFPELAALKGVQQSPAWHPEGDAYIHTLHCLDAYAKRRTGDEVRDLRIGFAVLAHDFGKATHTKLIDGKWKAHGHEAAGAAPATAFLRRLTDQTDLIQGTVALVVNHMTPRDLYDNAVASGRRDSMDSAVRRLALKLGKNACTLDDLALVVACDTAGRPPLPERCPEAEWLRERADLCQVRFQRPRQLVMGRDLIALGMTPSPAFAQILEQVFEKQISGEITTEEEGRAFASQLIAKQQAASVPFLAVKELSSRPDAEDLCRSHDGSIRVFHHGTQAPDDFDRFSCDGPPRGEEGVPLAPDSGADPTAFLGAHFAEERSVAAKFAHRSASWMRGRPHYFDGQKPKPRIITVALKVRNPMYFATEDELFDFIYRNASISDEQLLSHVMDVRYKTEPDSEAGDTWLARYDSDEALRVEVNKSTFSHPPTMEGYEETMRDQAAEFAESTRSLLQKQGYDGICYGNDVEGGTSWVAFAPEQVVRAYSEHFTPQGTSRFIQETERSPVPPRPPLRPLRSPSIPQPEQRLTR